MLVYIAHADGRVDQSAVVADHPITLGREAHNDIVLPSPEVSRKHLTVDVAADGLILTDSSANGTRLGPQKFKGQSAQCPWGTTVGVGPFQVTFATAAQVAAHGPPAQAVFPAPPSQPSPASPPTESGSLRPTAEEKPVATKKKPKKGKDAGPYREPAAAPAGDDDYAHLNVSVEVRRQMHRMLLENLDLASLEQDKMDDKAMRPKVRAALRRIVTQVADQLPPDTDTAQLIDELTDEALGLGPLERLIADDSVSEIMVVDPETIYIERNGKVVRTNMRFTDNDSVRAVIERIVTPLGRRIDESSPLVDARLKDGSRVNAIIPPLALRGPCITIRKFSKEALDMDDLIRFGSMTDPMARFLKRCVISRKNIIVSGGTGSGKTTLLNVLSGAIPEFERIITIEDAAELRLGQPHVVSLEARPANMEGRGEFSIRDLVKNSLRMRPDRIIVGECRSGEALDMLQAMNTGHEGSMTTTHANSPPEALSRLETLVLMAGVDMPMRAAREQIAESIDLVVQQTRFTVDGSRRITSISEVAGLDPDGEYRVFEIFSFERTGTGPKGEVLGEYRASGYLPTFLEDFIAQGLVKDGQFL
ncbi:MAG: Flp pilus assembly complex ATPase component TadA [Myxococcales bacterium]|nr:Flp pilus assembly complex ATPase component TadA [Myxococcales bacterium]